MGPNELACFIIFFTICEAKSRRFKSATVVKSDLKFVMIDNKKNGTRSIIFWRNILLFNY